MTDIKYPYTIEYTDPVDGEVSKRFETIGGNNGWWEFVKENLPSGVVCEIIDEFEDSTLAFVILKD